MRNSYLKKMGIDVWVLRDKPQGDHKAHPQGDPTEPVPTGATDKGLPEFHLCFLNYRTFGVCLSLEYEQEVISPSAKRFIADIALSMKSGGHKPTLNSLKWPESSRESSDRETPQDAVSYRMRGLPPLVLVFGDQAVDVIPGLQPDESGISTLDGRRVLALAAISEICQGAEGKRHLWQRLNSLRDSP